MTNEGKVDKMSNTLKIVRASAGSGKTYHLALEYIRLLFLRADSFRHTLAVTFTNKATGEMKERILWELYLLLSGGESSYKAILQSEFHLDDAAIKAKASDILKRILHHYSYFSITTIDRFFQRVIRAVVRELGLYGGYRIELDEDTVLQEAVGRMLDALDDGASKQLLRWMMDFSEDKMGREQSWSLHADILRLGKEIFKETYRELDVKEREAFTDKQGLLAYRQDLVVFSQNFEDKLKALGRRAIACAEREGLALTDFVYKKTGPVTIFGKWAQGESPALSVRVLALLEGVERWSGKSESEDKKASIASAYGGMSACLEEGVEHYTQGKVVYDSIQEVFKNFYSLGLLSDLAGHVRAYEKEQNIMLLSDSSQLLQALINGDDLPFVYEKVGTYIRHFMIDEFQDTSGMQWSNFRPLLENGLASGNMSLVVGDVKQAIYRWRNSDWSLLSEKINVEMRNSCSLEEHSLPYNWRSKEKVVHFNNSFFHFASRYLQDEINDSLHTSATDVSLKEEFSERILRAYNACMQEVPSFRCDGGGFVRFESFDGSGSQQDKEEMALSKMMTALEELLSSSYRMGDIAILVRTKKEGRAIAQCLLNNERPEGGLYPFVSDDALVIGGSSMVQLMISFLRHSLFPDDEENNFCFALLYKTELEKMIDSEALTSLSSQSKTYFASLGFLTNEEREFYGDLPKNTAFEACRAVQRLWGINVSDDVFLRAFMDMIWDFEKQQGGGIQRFLDWWDEDGHKRALESTATEGAIRIMTIHKSKGLEFKVVLLPFACWEIMPQAKGTQGSTLWCRPSVPPLDSMPMLPVRYSSRLKDTIFANEYYTETIQSYVDNLNLAYVAFTRAEEVLWGFFPSGTKSSLAALLEVGFQYFSSSSYHASTQEIEKTAFSWDVEQGVFELGNCKQSRDREGVEAVSSRECNFHYDSVQNLDEMLMLHFKSTDFFTQDARINYGVLMHKVFCEIETQDDIEKVLLQLMDSGELGQEDVDSFRENLDNSFKDERVQLWFSGQYDVYNERAVLLPGGSKLRPDRILSKGEEAIVIDYKFGQLKDRRHYKQVLSYKHQLQKLGYTEVKAYLWYFELGDIEEVN